MSTFTRGVLPQKTVGDLPALIQEVAELMDGSFKERSVVFRFQPQLGIPTFAFDPGQIRQVLINLFKNALEAMPGGGEITITSRVKGTNAEVSITDTGGGMSPEVSENIFQPYFTTKEKGTGLGLAICQDIVQEHGGCIFADSSPGKGSTFTIQFPLQEAPLELEGEIGEGPLRRSPGRPS